MKKGSITLGEVAARTSHINVACSRCERRGRYRLAKLIASLGEDFAVTDLGAHISDCSKWNAPAWERCDVYYPGLRDSMGDDKPAGPDPKPEHSDDDED
ncbi:UNVERIFIED_ORG: hypothetical protein BDU10_7487 [Burkholderia sp. CF145]